MKTWYTSDLHFYHANIIRFCGRPYSSVEDMNEALVNNWNKLVGPEDTVYFVGDFSMAARPVEILTNRLVGNKIMIAGNHDFVHTVHRKSQKSGTAEKWRQLYLEWGWKEIHMELDRDIEGFSKVRICHFPYRDSCPDDIHENGEVRYSRYRPIDDGKILICGHVHEKWKHRFTNKGTLMVNVGVDVWDMKPVSEEDLCSYISQQLVLR